MSIPRLFRRPQFWIITVASLAVLVGGGIWAYKACRTPERVFWGMIEQNLATSGVTVSAERTGNGTTANQIVQYSFGAQNLSRTITHLSQTGTAVTNESIGTPTTDYTRYLSIKTDQKTPAGKPMDFSGIIGLWGKSAAGSGGQLFAQGALGTGLPLASVAVPIGSLAPEQREQLVNQMRNDKLFTVDFAKTKTQVKDGRTQYVYDLKMSPVSYAAMLKRFTKSIGLHTYDELDPKTMEGQPEYLLRVTVDVRSRRMVLAATNDGSIKQVYSGYDVPIEITLPAKPISITDLQSRITKAQE